MLDNGKPFERMGRKAAGLNLPPYGGYGGRAAEGKRLHPPRDDRLSEKNHRLSKKNNGGLHHVTSVL